MKTKLKSTLLIFSFILLYNYSFAAKYYFSTSGDDARTAAQAQNSSTPWKSIKKLNSIFKSLKPGDEVLFKRGDIFYGTIKINKSGAQGRPIKISAYGSGAKPIITSLVTLNNWKNIGNGIYESGNSVGDEVSIVLINNEIHEVGRFPNSDAPNGGYLTINSHSGNGSVNSKELNSSSNFSGGEVVIRKNQWVIDRHKISNHSGNRINYNGGGSTLPANNYGFFIQGHKNTLDQKGEWYYNPSSKKINVFFGSENPNSTKVEATSMDYLVTKSYGASHITIDNLHLKGANVDAIHISGGRGVLIENTDVEYSGEHGITSMSIKDLVINNCKINHSFNNGIYLRYGNEGAKITNNLIENTFVFPGTSKNGNSNGIGIFALDDNTLIEYNRVINTGYSGIYFGGNSTVIKNNLIDTYCMLKNDGGGIYSYGGPNNKSYRNRKLIGNIILNGVGSTDGVPKKAFTSKGQAEGIFLDDNSNGIEVSGNTISHAENSGIKLANSRNIVVQNNTIYSSNSQILIGNRGRASDTENLTISNNILFSKYSDQWAYIIRTKNNDIAGFGTFKDNYLYRPLGDPYNILVSFMKGDKEDDKILNLRRWQNNFNKDHNSSNYSKPLQSFEIKKLLSGNIFDNGSLEKAISGLVCNNCESSWDNGKLSGGSIKVESPSYSSVGMVVGSVKKAKNYILKFKATSNKEGALRIYLRHAGSPWQEVSPSTTVELNSGKQEYTVLLNPYDNIEKSTIMFSSDEKNWTFWMDDIEFKEAEVEMIEPEDQFLFEYNASKSPRTVALDGSFVDVKNKAYSGTVTLEPFSSLLLIRTSKANTPKPEYSLKTNIASPKNNQEVAEGTKLVIHAEASATDQSINKVEFFNGNTLLGTSIESPYSYTWEQAPSGNHKIIAVVTGSNNRKATSEPVTIKVIQEEKPQSEKPQTEKPQTGNDNQSDGATGGNNNQDGSFSPLYFNIGSKSAVEFQGEVFTPIPESSVVSDNSNSSYPQVSESGLFQTSEYGEKLEYAISVPNGTYTVQTYHHEVYYGKSGPNERSGQRIFDISIENQTMEKDLDMYSANGNMETVLTFETITVTDGILNISMESSVENAIISGVSIIASEDFVKSPVDQLPENALLINAGGLSDALYGGNNFISDYSTRYFSGGSNNSSNTKASNEALFQTHRFARQFGYDIPVSNGVYTVITYHNEIYFGNAVGESGSNKRVFDIYLEDDLVKDDLDLFEENSNQPFSLRFENIQVNDGEINLKFLASINSATISGIAIIDQSKKPGSDGANLRIMADQQQVSEVEEPQLFVEEQNEQIQLYPNPANDFVKLSMNKDLGRFSILIHNLNGQLIDHLDPEDLNTENGEYIIPVDQLKEGVYVITLAGEREIIKRLKLIVAP